MSNPIELSSTGEIILNKMVYRRKEIADFLGFSTAKLRREIKAMEELKGSFIPSYKYIPRQIVKMLLEHLAYKVKDGI